MQTYGKYTRAKAEEVAQQPAQAQQSLPPSPPGASVPLIPPPPLQYPATPDPTHLQTLEVHSGYIPLLPRVEAAMAAQAQPTIPQPTPPSPTENPPPALERIVLTERMQAEILEFAEINQLPQYVLVDLLPNTVHGKYCGNTLRITRTNNPPPGSKRVLLMKNEDSTNETNKPVYKRIGIDKLQPPPTATRT